MRAVALRVGARQGAHDRVDRAVLREPVFDSAILVGASLTLPIAMVKVLSKVSPAVSVARP